MSESFLTSTKKGTSSDFRLMYVPNKVTRKGGEKMKDKKDRVEEVKVSWEGVVSSIEEKLKVDLRRLEVKEMKERKILILRGSPLFS